LAGAAAACAALHPGTVLGWLAATGRRARKHVGRTLKGESYKVARYDEPERALRTGKRVSHQNFGYSKTFSVDGSKLEIDARRLGARK